VSDRTELARSGHGSDRTGPLAIYKCMCLEVSFSKPSYIFFFLKTTLVYILGESLALDVSKASNDTSIVFSIDVLSFLKASLKSRSCFCRRFLEESLTVLVVPHFNSH